METMMRIFVGAFGTSGLLLSLSLLAYGLMSNAVTSFDGNVKQRISNLIWLTSTLIIVSSSILLAAILGPNAMMDILFWSCLSLLGLIPIWYALFDHSRHMDGQILLLLCGLAWITTFGYLTFMAW